MDFFYCLVLVIQWELENENILSTFTYLQEYSIKCIFTLFTQWYSVHMKEIVFDHLFTSSQSK